MNFVSEDHLLRHYIKDVEKIFLSRYKDHLHKYKKLQENVLPSLDKIRQLREISWKVFHLRMMMGLYLRMLSSGQTSIYSIYLHHTMFQLNEALTPSMREKHSALLQRHEQSMSRLLNRLQEKIYVDANHDIYVFYNGVAAA